jgi:alkylation response protein AidB-like acyl-CoA dehydrogenase
LVGVSHPSPSPLREADAARVEVTDPGLSAWQRICVNDVPADPLLVELEAYLDEPRTRARLWQLEADEEYPGPVLDGLRARGLMKVFAPDPNGGAAADARVTAFHMSALNALTSRRDTSLAVTISVNALGLLPAYVAASPEQLEQINRAVSSGTFSSLMLSELSHGSNLLANQARAERGVLDGSGQFVTVAEDAKCTHYRLSGEKDLINGPNEHGLFFVFLRTRHFDAGATVEPLQARADFTMFWIERGEGFHPLPQWHTLPARGADISGVRFDDMIVPASAVLGREHGGMSLAQKTLILSRGGVASLASGCISRACDLATNYARKRAIYGEPIHTLGAIADHLIRLEALDRTVAAIAVRTAAMLNAVGLGAAHYTAVAKVVATRFAEEGVREGQLVLGARALLRDLPYERLMRDVVLYGVFDGTSHVMLQELSHRLALEARRAAESTRDEKDTVERMRAVYAAPPEPLYASLRARQGRLLLPLDQHLRQLDALSSSVSIAPLAQCCDALFALVRACELAEVWRDDQGLRIRAAELFAQLEGIAALIELCDLDRRAALGIPPLADGERALDQPVYRFALAWLGGRVVAGVRELALRVECPPGWLHGADDAAELAAIEARLSAGHGEVLRACRAALRK